MKLLELIDGSLNWLVENQGNRLPGTIPANMATGEVVEDDKDWAYWVPVQSAVTSSQIQTLEKNLGVELSPQYKSLLQHRHFLECHIGEVSLFPHPSENWQGQIDKNVFDSWPREHLIDNGYLPFADYSDWGLWCFALKEQSSDGEYPIYEWDHEQPNSYNFIAPDLERALLNAKTQGSGSHVQD